ncbi:helix-turn-helix domain-containing protein [Shouchella shacheensis]|uniref:helix-turn-helix domain-containing protein n=1 Tax=Shouchella shacheensis TaxID=1649580 RepID=UPI00073FC50E|nr:helix-turn-helix domain-containing protein [Shouchella shacheensis]
MREDQLSEVWTISQSFARTRSISEVLDVLASSVPVLVPGADMVIIYLYDENLNVLRLAASVGVVVSSLRRIAFQPGESMTGQVFVSGEPVLCMAEQDVREKMANISSDNLQWFRKGVAEKEIRSSFSVPLLSDNRCLGTLAVNQHQAGTPFSQQEVMVVSQLAVQGALAIDNARLYERMVRQKRDLDESRIVQERFTHVLLEGGGLEKVLKTLRRLLETQATVSFTETMDDAAFAYPILQGPEQLGWLVFDQKAYAFSRKDHVVIEKAAEAIAINFRNENRRSEKELRVRESQFHSVLNGASLAEAGSLFFGYRDKQMRCLVFTCDPSSEPGTYFRKLEKLVCGIDFEGIVLEYRSSWVVILNVNEEAQVEAFAGQLQAIASSSSQAKIGVSRSRHINEIAVSYAEALEALEQGEGSSFSIVYYAKLGYRRLWGQMGVERQREFVNDHLGPLLAMEPIYEETLEAFICHNRSRQQTADALYIHTNTLYQRLKKIEHELGSSLNEDATWITVVIAFEMNKELSDQ